VRRPRLVAVRRRLSRAAQAASAAGHGLLVALAGLLALGLPLPRTVLTGSVHACLGASPEAAAVGIQLRVLAQDPACPRGSFAPGPQFTEVAQVSFAVSGATIVAGVALLAWALGFGWWLRQVRGAVRAWAGRRLERLTAPAARPVRRLGPAVADGFIADLRGAVLARAAGRRGPPGPVPA